MKVVAQCAGCDKTYRVAEKYCGRTIRCKKCGEGFKVPKLEESLEESGLEEDIEPEPEPPEPPRSKRRPTGKLKKKASGKAPAAKKKATGKVRALAKKEADEPATDDDDEPEAAKRGKGTARARALKKGKDEAPAKKSTGKFKKKATGKMPAAKKKATGKVKALAKKEAEPEDAEPQRKKGKTSAATKAAAKKGKTSAATKALKRRDSRGAKALDKKDNGRRKKTTGAFKRDKSGVRRKTGSARRAGRDKDEGGRPRRGKGPLLIAGGAGLLVVVILVVVFALPGGPSAAAKSFYDEVKVNLDDADQKRLDGNFLLAGQKYDAVLKATAAPAFPLDNEYLPGLAARLSAARERLKEARELEAIYNKLENGEGQDEALSKVNNQDAAIRLAAITLLDKRARDEPEFAKALAMLARDKDERVAQKARGVLRGLGGKDALPYLMDALDNPGSKAQEDALEKISVINDPAALGALHKCLTILDPAKNPEDARIAGQAVDSLGTIADKSSVKPLEDFAKKCSGELKDAVDAAIESCKGG